MESMIGAGRRGRRRRLGRRRRRCRRRGRRRRRGRHRPALARRPHRALEIVLAAGRAERLHEVRLAEEGVLVVDAPVRRPELLVARRAAEARRVEDHVLRGDALRKVDGLAALGAALAAAAKLLRDLGRGRRRRRRRRRQRRRPLPRRLARRLVVVVVALVRRVPVLLPLLRRRRGGRRHRAAPAHRRRRLGELRLALGAPPRRPLLVLRLPQREVGREAVRAQARRL